MFRVENCLQSQSYRELYIGIDGGQWYKQKVSAALQQSAASATNSTAALQLPVPVPPIAGWRRFPSQAIPPSFCYGSIYHYIIETAVLCSTTTNDCNSDGEDGLYYGTDKSFRRGKQYIQSGYVTNVLDTKHKDHYFCKATVKFSFNTDTFYTVNICLSILSGAVMDASCHCKASSMGRCSHVCAVLLTIEQHVMVNGYDSVACTSKQCDWNAGSKRKNPQPLHVPSYNKSRPSDRVIGYDPCPSVDDNFKRDFIVNLPLTGVGTMWETILQVKYEDYDIPAERKTVLLQHIDCFIQNASDAISSCDGPVCIVREQRSDEWLQHRHNRITASKVKAVMSATSNAARARLVNEIVWGVPLRQTTAMRYGCDNEAKARHEYLRVKAACVAGYSVEETGLWVNRKWPVFGCSPDGIVFDPSSTPSNGLLEIKCPYVLRDNLPTDLCKLSNTQCLSFCCKLDNGALKVKKLHTYYAQMQFAMAVMEMTWCDFVIWTPHGISIERVPFDADWPQMSSQLLQCYKSWILPDYFEMKVPRKLSVCVL